MFIRWINGFGGLLNNQGLNYDKLDDDEILEIEEAFLGLSQPPTDNRWGSDVIFAFTEKGEEKQKRLIELCKKMSKTPPKRIILSPDKYDVVWEDGTQVALKKKMSKRMSNPIRKSLDY